MQTIIFFDIDYTLWDTGKYRQIFFQAIAEKLHIHDENFHEKMEQLYRSYMDSRGHFFPDEFALIVATNFHKEPFGKEILSCILDPQNFRQALYSDTKLVIETLYKEGFLLGIFSRGIDSFQKSKIVSITDFFAKEHTYIFEEKDKKLAEVLADYVDYKVYIIDDLPRILQLAKNISKDIITVWIANGYVERNKKDALGFTPDYSIMKLQELLKIVKRA